jgi:hypothetical protein
MKTTITTLSLALMTFFMSCNTNKKTEQIALVATKTIPKNPTKTSNQSIKVALLLDTSNSMDGLIDQARAQLWKIVNELSYAKCEDKKPNLQIALYEYGNDNLNSREGYIRQVLAFSNDLDEISKQLFSLTTNGGNEYCGQVISTALSQLQWNENPDDLKLIFIAGNEPFTQGQVSYTKATKKANAEKVTVNTIFCGDYNEGISSYWKAGSDLTHGNYMAINHNQETAYISSPYDDEILEQNRLLNSTYVAYGKIGNTKMKLQADQDSNAKTYSKENAVSRTISKSTHLYENSSWDLVDASETEIINYETLKESELPSELKGKTTAEIQTYIASKKQERNNIKNEINKLNLKRKDYVSKQKTDKTDSSLEEVMLQAIKKQAQQKNYKWD